MSKVVVLFSGGMDSTTLLYKLIEEGNECYPLTILYGQRHEKEVLAAKSICNKLGLWDEYEIVDLSDLRTLLESSLTGYGDIPEGHYTDKSMKQTVVPNRNMILISIAAGYAESIGAKFVAYAAHSGDHTIYPDCRPEFFNEMDRVLKLGTDGKVGLITPFGDISKTIIVKLGSKINVPYDLTWSCYKGGDKQCGRCGTCVERKEAFELAGVEDPTEYEEV